MKFGDKYELLESLTTGVVETFVANDKIRGERVLVHILDCEPQKPNQPTVQWVLESFRRLAPEPAALVLETGRYSGTLYAYLVTKLPEDAALRNWVQRYKAQPRDTQEFPPSVTMPNPPPQPPPAEAVREVAREAALKDPARPPGPVTALFREFDLQAKSGPHSPSPKATEPPSRPLPNVNVSADRSGPRIAPPWDPGVPGISLPPRPEPNVSKPPDSFRSDFARTFPTEPARPPAPPQDGPKPGEFTSFFQGPFRGDRPLETPAISPNLSPLPPPEPPRKKVGDFTAVFGTPTPQPEEPPPARGIAGNEPAGSGFTDFFNPGLLSRTSSTTPSPSIGLPRATVDATPVVPPPVKESFIPPPPVSQVAPPPPIFPAPVPIDPPPAKAPAVQPPVPSALPSDGATRAFARPTMEPAPGQPPPPSGPSAYTRVISVRPADPAADAAGAEKPGANPKAPLPAFAPPPLPAPPPKPKVAAPEKPALPKAPKGALPEPPAVSIWPLILTLTVVFIIAVLVVLYFVLKH
jgi:hypothetical protein